MAECQHDLACRRCGASIGEIGLAAADREDADVEAALQAANDELVEQLVTSVRVERAGAHERVTIWLRGANVGALTAGEGDGQRLRRLLLSEDVVARARDLVRDWKAQDGFNLERIDDLTVAIDAVDRLMRLTAESPPVDSAEQLTPWMRGALAAMRVPEPSEAPDLIVRLRDVLLEDPRVIAVDPHVGGRFLAQALSGLTMRQHFDAEHPGQIEEGLVAAPTDERDREAWLFGYRFVEREEAP
jgi:hypothetical protein